jgi:hypothetical protein
MGRQTGSPHISDNIYDNNEIRVAIHLYGRQYIGDTANTLWRNWKSVV